MVDSDDGDGGGEMLTYEFALVVDGISPEDPDHDERLAAAGADDAMVFSDGDRTVVAFYRDAASPVEALWAAVASIEEAYPDAGICRLDRDLVSTTDIADRLGVSREAVRKWVVGERVAGQGFPMPVGTVSHGTRVWEWAAVHEWLVTHKRISVEDTPIPPDVATQFEAQLLARRGAVAPPRLALHEWPGRTVDRADDAYVVTAAEGRPIYVTGSYHSSTSVQVTLSGTDPRLPKPFKMRGSQRAS